MLTRQRLGLAALHRGQALAELIALDSDLIALRLSVAQLTTILGGLTAGCATVAAVSTLAGVTLGIRGRCMSVNRHSVDVGG
ncbi:Uncharacterised protein [Mycobacteroides abscessus subsp. abscessus]|nr:Uncharacterised protein [Mycobacteroides abscessus subsp. abscessus]